MKKTLLSIVAGVLSVSFASAQCTPDPALAGESFGLWPDSLATVYTHTGAGAESRYVDLVTFTDTVIAFEIVPGSPSNVTVYIDAFKILEVRNVPNDFTYGTNIDPNDESVNDTVASTDPAYAPWGIWYNGGDVPNQTPTQGCVYINGTETGWLAVAAMANLPGGEGAVQLEIDVDARVAATDPDLSSIIQNGSWMSTVPSSFGGGPITVDNYWLVAKESGVGITEVNENEFMVLDNFPNPFDGTTSIMFNLPYDSEDIDFNVFNVLGELQHTETVNGRRGMNSILFDGSQLATGLYIYTLSEGNNTVTGRMTVK